MTHEDKVEAWADIDGPWANYKKKQGALGRTYDHWGFDWNEFRMCRISDWYDEMQERYGECE